MTLPGIILKTIFPRRIFRICEAAVAKKGMKKVDWRESAPKMTVPKIYKAGEREKETESFMELTAPTQKAFRSKEAEEGEKLAPFWKPDDIGTDNFGQSTTTAYLRRTE